MPNTILKRWNGSAFEELYPKTVTSQIAASGTASSSTFLRGDGQWINPIASNTIIGSTFPSAYNAPGGGTNTGVILYGDFYGWHTRSIGSANQILTVSSGVPTWVTPNSATVGLGNVTNESKATMFTSAALTGTPTAPTAAAGTNTTQIATTAFVQASSFAIARTKYKATGTSNTSGSTARTSITTITLLANKYYHLDVTGMYSKGSTSGTTSPVINIAVDNTTGTPTINGRFEWLNGSAATAYTVSNTNGAITTSDSARGFTAATATGSTITTTPWGLKALFYTGTSDKVLNFYISSSSTVSGVCSVDMISIKAVEVAA